MYPKRPSPSTETEVFPAFPRISPHCPSSAALSGKKRLFSLQTQKCRRGFLKFLPPADLPLPFPASFSFPFSCKFSFPAPLTAGRKKSEVPRPNRPSPPLAGKGGRKKRKYGERVRNKTERKRAKKAARAVRRKATRVGKRKKRRETAEAPPKVLGAPLPKKARCRRQETDRKKRHKGQVLQKILAASKNFASRTLRQSRFYSGDRESAGRKDICNVSKLADAAKKPETMFRTFFTRAVNYTIKCNT